MRNRIAIMSTVLLVASNAYAQSVGASIGIGGIGKGEVSAGTGGPGVAASLSEARPVRSSAIGPNRGAEGSDLGKGTMRFKAPSRSSDVPSVAKKQC